MRVLISGAGIAGPTLVYWLAHCGWTPTLVEKAPALRRGGYMIDFRGAGFDVADRMGLRPEIFSKSPTWWPGGASGTGSYFRTIH
jgi:2-polyprenyl-6-methoxyphenol hydroxylase-like FAD-dependent oxidoreductase